jgi:hypothetical protein
VKFPDDERQALRLPLWAILVHAPKSLVDAPKSLVDAPKSLVYAPNSPVTVTLEALVEAGIPIVTLVPVRPDIAETVPPMLATNASTIYLPASG